MFAIYALVVNVYLTFTLQLLRECKDVLLGGVLVKDYYLYLVDGVVNLEDSSSENTESDIEGFEQDLQSLLQVHTYIHTYIHTFIDHFPKGAFQCQLQRKG